MRLSVVRSADEDNRKAGTLRRPDLVESSLPKSRYAREFSEISEIGAGSFNKVCEQSRLAVIAARSAICK